MYTQIRKKIHLKQGGKIPKFQNPWEPIQLDKPITDVTTLSFDKIDTSPRGLYEASDFGKNLGGINFTTGDTQSTFGETTTHISNDGTVTTAGDNTTSPDTKFWAEVEEEIRRKQEEAKKKAEEEAKEVEAENNAKISKGSNIAAQAFNALDNATLGNANFGSQSQAIDGAVHTVSGALLKSGNPYCAIAGAALEGANFLTKAGGQTVQGYDVDIDNSGYGNLGHMESSSSRDFLTLVGLGGLKTKSVQAKLARRNEQVRTALAAAQISEDQKFESEARMNSVENTIMNNQIALAGGLQTNLLGS